MEAIAAEADLSPMTLFNYYGSKGGLLLSLVAESDRQLVMKINRLIETRFESLEAATTAFSLTIVDHAFSYLDRDIWRHVWATSILEGGSNFGRSFFALERELVRLLSELLDRLQADGLLRLEQETSVAATVIYNIHNARFIEYAANAEISRNAIEALIKQDMSFVSSLMRATLEDE